MFTLHPQLSADTFVVGDFPLCRLLLMNDAGYPWFILVPRRPEVREIFELSDDDQQQLLRESSQLSRVIKTEFSADKLNVAALGNMVPQLHVHHIVRYQTDQAWPKPVWDLHPASPYQSAGAAKICQRLAPLLNDLTPHAPA